MRLSRFTIPCLCGALAFVAVCITVPAVHAVVAPSTWAGAIQVQGESPGTEFDDWAASGIPIATTDALDNPGAFLVDINTVQIANDANFIYLRVTYHTNQSVGTFLGFDNDQDPNTGFDVFALGLVGSELGYQNDFPFEQGTGVFNTGQPLTGGPLGNGGALIFPFFNINGSQKEYAIPLSAAFTVPSAPAFPGSSIDLLVYTDAGLGDVTEVISYTLATSPGGPGDFDGDGDVDGADFLVWQRRFGQTSTMADLAIWETNYGNTTPISAASAVPEASSILLVGAGLITLLSRRRQRANA